MELIWQTYNKDSPHSEEVVGVKRKLKRTTFTSIMSRLTTSDMKQRACVDYNLHALVYENGSILKRIIDDNIEVCKLRKELNKKLTAVVENLKYSYVTHLDDSSIDPMQNPSYGLNHGSFPKKFSMSTCCECNSVFKFLEEVRSNIVNKTTQIENILTGSSFKFKQYIAHKVRADEQDKRIKEMFEWVRDGRERERVVLFCHFKVKVETQRRRETQVKYFEKDGMSLHVTAVFFKPRSKGEFVQPKKKMKPLTKINVADLSVDARRKYNEKRRTEGNVCYFLLTMLPRMRRNMIEFLQHQSLKQLCTAYTNSFQRRSRLCSALKMQRTTTKMLSPLSYQNCARHLDSNCHTSCTRCLLRQELC